MSKYNEVNSEEFEKNKERLQRRATVMSSDLDNELGKKATLRDFINKTAREQGAKVAQDNFHTYALAWESIGRKWEGDLDKLYSEYFELNLESLIPTKEKVEEYNVELKIADYNDTKDKTNVSKNENNLETLYLLKLFGFYIFLLVFLFGIKFLSIYFWGSDYELEDFIDETILIAKFAVIIPLILFEMLYLPFKSEGIRSSIILFYEFFFPPLIWLKKKLEIKDDIDVLLFWYLGVPLTFLGIYLSFLIIVNVLPFLFLLVYHLYFILSFLAILFLIRLWVHDKSYKIHKLILSVSITILFIFFYEYRDIFHFEFIRDYSNWYRNFFD